MTDIDLTAISDEWEELVSTGIVLAQDMDASRWQLGDLGCKVQKRYGSDMMGQYSSQIGIANAQTFRSYVRVARRYEIATRNAFVDTPVTFTHFKTAMRAGADAEAWLVEAAKNAWTVKRFYDELAAALGKPVPPVKLWEGEGRVYADGTATCIELSEFNPAFAANMPRYQVVTVKVYAMGADQSVEADEMAEAAE